MTISIAILTGSHGSCKVTPITRCGALGRSDAGRGALVRLAELSRRHHLDAVLTAVDGKHAATFPRVTTRRRSLS